MFKKLSLIAVLFVSLPFVLTAMENNDAPAGLTQVAGVGSSVTDSKIEKFKKTFFDLCNQAYEGIVAVDEQVGKMIKKPIEYLYKSPRWMALSVGAVGGYLGLKVLDKSLLAGTALLGYLSYKTYDAYKLAVEDDF
ncbi:MAG: hypothetical protein BWY54_00794 [Candidatus Dependentiae bacterium ADurb.Bin331]|nr:MAG: hypothetical protein BWY54_00794 [Candidatus Dependentiae bacterium ADurb.Bin331]